MEKTIRLNGIETKAVNLHKLTLRYIYKNCFNVKIIYKNKLIVYHNGYITVYNKNGDYESSFVASVEAYNNFQEFKKIIKNCAWHYFIFSVE